MIQRLPIATEKVKADKTSENLLNEICQRTYYFIQQMKLKDGTI